MKQRYLIVLCIIIWNWGALSSPILASPNICTFRSKIVPPSSPSWQPDASPCDRRSIPLGKRTGGRDLRLECSSEVDNHVRRNFPLTQKNLDEIWDFEVLEDWAGMQKYRQEIEPKIEWKGQIPYETVEVWEWTDCRWGYDLSCPKKMVTKTHVVTDSDGKSHTETYIDYEDQPCWHDEDITEARHCSYETMTYDAEFRRPSLDEWNPASPGYHAELPNKYDLLPSEQEVVQVYNASSSFLKGVLNGGRSRDMDPTVEVGNAWNKYSSTETFDNGSTTAQCVFGHDYHMNVVIDTIERIVRKTPNAFKIPVDEFGQEVSPFVGNEVETIDRNGTLEDVIVKPTELGLTDTSSVIIDSLSRVSRKMTAEIEKVKEQEGVNSNVSNQQLMASKKSKKSKEGFWKDTHVEIVLYERNSILERDVRKTERFHTRGADAIAFQDDKSRDQYRIRLDDFYIAGAPGFMEWATWFEAHLIPGKDYDFEIRMFQEGVPFYTQKTLLGGIPWSDPLALHFHRAKGFDKRGSWTRFRNWRQEPFWKKLITRPF